MRPGAAGKDVLPESNPIIKAICDLSKEYVPGCYSKHEAILQKNEMNSSREEGAGADDAGE